MKLNCKMQLSKLTIPFSVLVITGLIVYGVLNPPQKPLPTGTLSDNGNLILPWGNMGQELLASGVLDASKLEALYAQRGGLTPEEKNMIYGNPETITVTEENADFVLNLLWAAGLANKNDILSKGEMMDLRYSGAENFASTGGWSLGKGNVMGHYSTHNMINLSASQQNLVDMVSKNIYRPCCGNSTHFPDCNHGMAMLGMLEILAAKGASESELYSAALVANTLWFPTEYANIRNYFAKEKLPQDSRAMVGFAVASGQGYQNVLSKVQPVQPKNNGGCGV